MKNATLIQAKTKEMETEETKTEEKSKQEETKELEQEEQKEKSNEQLKSSVEKPKKTARIKKFFDTKLGRIALGIIGLVVAVLFLMIDGAEEPVLFGLAPVRSIFVIAIVLSLFVSLVYKFMTDQTLMKELKKDLKKYQDQMKRHKQDMARLQEIQKKAMSVNMKYMKQSFKPMIITLIPFFAVFAWLRGVFGDTIVIPLGFWEGHLGWIGTYIILSLVYTTIFRKIMKVV